MREEEEESRAAKQDCEEKGVRIQEIWMESWGGLRRKELYR